MNNSMPLWLGFWGKVWIKYLGVKMHHFIMANFHGIYDHNIPFNPFMSVAAKVLSILVVLFSWSQYWRRITDQISTYNSPHMMWYHYIFKNYYKKVSYIWMAPFKLNSNHEWASSILFYKFGLNSIIIFIDQLLQSHTWMT